MEANQATSLYSASTELCADAIACHPHMSGLFALGTYEVTQAEAAQERGGEAEKQQEEADDQAEAASASTSPQYSRRGQVSLHRLLGSDDKVECERLDMHSGPAVLDMAWAPHSSGFALLTAEATSSISLRPLSFSSPSNTPSFGAPQQRTMNTRRALVLSLDLSSRKPGLADAQEQHGDAKLLMSQSDGSLSYLPSLSAAFEEGSAGQAEETRRPDSRVAAAAESDDEDDDADEETLAAHAALNAAFEGRPRGLETWAAHGHEAWIAAWDCWSDGTVGWSGGDDLQMRGWDIRMSNAGAGRQATFINKRSFDGGVTAMQSSHLRQHLWAVGSYDGSIRLFDARNPLRPLSSTNVGGGVWRVKWHPFDASRLLLGTMHDGFKILTLPVGTEQGQLPPREEMHIVRRFDAHESLAYGCDWDREAPEAEQTQSRVVSCSFYDRRLHVWRG